MTLDDKIARVKDLIGKREEIDAELAVLLSGTAREPRKMRCSICDTEGHTARTCTQKTGAA
ncbi:hypothetical protein [Rhodoplanes sp. SY1]|uniref:hypothetical protein n=1 Tax=Rhodoplanes sp. SY1 TaxID=3166646 RepID=UPI0038B5A4B5